MYLVVLCAVVSVVHATPFTTPRNDDCVKVPPMCNKLISLNYTKMRLPNLLNHSRYEDVASDIKIWQPLLNSSKCNAGNQLKYFLCFTYAPVCVNKLISPCKSFCETVRDSCDPVMRRYNYSWPSFFNCNQRKKFLPDSSQMCINLPMLGITAIRQDKCSCKGSYSRKTIKSEICNSDFVFSGWVTSKHIKHGHGHILVKAHRVFKPQKTSVNILTPQSLKLLVSNNKKPCRCSRLRVKRKPRGSGRYLIIGSNVGGKMQVNAIRKFKDPHDIVRMVKQC